MTMLFTFQESMAYGLAVGRLQFVGMIPIPHPGSSVHLDEVSDSDDDDDDGSRFDLFLSFPRTMVSTESSSFSEQDTGCMPGVRLRFGEARRGAALLLAEPLPC